MRKKQKDQSFDPEGIAAFDPVMRMATRIEQHVSRAGTTDELDDDLVDDPTDDPDSFEQLGDGDRNDLARFKNALAFLHGIRNNLGSNVEKESETNHADSSLVDVSSSPTRNVTADAIGSAANELPVNIGRFRIERMLGQGGFARVFLARDPKLNRLIALKILRPAALASEETRKRFEREAQAAAMLSHPGIVPVFETGSVGPIRYIASAWCDGESLDQWFAGQDRTIEFRLAAEIVSELADAVQHAHQRNIIHRDLKPGNVLVDGRNDSHDESGNDHDSVRSSILNLLQITDFGLAKYEDDSQFLTTEGAIVGTPAYMSPEQAAGEDSISPGTDVYSLGAMFYELLTGKIPLLGKNHVATLQAVQYDEPVAPRSIRKNIPRELEAICLKCLSKNPDDRYASAFLLRQDLQNWLMDLPIVARRPTWTQRTGLWCRRNSTLAAMLVFSGLILITGLTLTTWKSLELNRSLAIVVQEKEVSRKSLHNAQDTIDELVNDVVTDPTISGQKREEFVLKSIELQRELLGLGPDNQRVLIASAKSWRQLFDLQLEREDYGAAQQSLDKTIELIRRLPEDHGFRIEFEEQMVINQGLLDLRTSPEKVLGPAPSNGHSESSGERIARSQQYHVAGLAQARQNDFAGAVLSFESGLQCLEGIPVDDPFSEDMRCRLLQDLGYSELDLGDTVSARQSVSESLKICEPANRIGGHRISDEHAARCYLTLGKIDRAEKNWTAASQNFRTSREIYQALIASEPRSMRLARRLIFIAQSLSEIADESGDHQEQIRELTDLLNSFKEFDARVREDGPIQSTVIEQGLKLAGILQNEDNPEAFERVLQQVESLLVESENISAEELAKFLQLLSEFASD